MIQTLCERCGANKPAHDFVRAGSPDGTWRLLSSRCFSDEMAQFANVPNFQHPSFTSLRLRDAHDEDHKFHFRSVLIWDQLLLEAFELKDDDESAGYRFQILGDPKAEPFALLSQLVLKMKRALATSHLVAEAGSLRIADTIVRGRIEWTGSESANQPFVVIDGHCVEWGDFGAMLGAFEGWQFRLELVDPSEEA
jgi:hypothetical protein